MMLGLGRRLCSPSPGGLRCHPAQPDVPHEFSPLTHTPPSLVLVCARFSVAPATFTLAPQPHNRGVRLANATNSPHSREDRAKEAGETRAGASRCSVFLPYRGPYMPRHARARVAVKYGGIRRGCKGELGQTVEWWLVVRGWGWGRWGGGW